MDIKSNLIWYAEQLLSEAKMYESVAEKQDYTSDCLKQGIARNLKTISKQLNSISKQLQPK